MDTKRRYFVAKCDNIDRLEAASRTCIWACCDRKTNPQPRDVLHSAMLDGDVILVFSVNNCHGWHGYAQMITSPNGSTSAATLDGKSWHTFSVRWCRLYMHEFRPDQCLPFSMTEQLLCADGVTPANSARNLEELRPTCGTSLCQLIDDYFTQLSLERQMKTKQKRDIQKSRAFFRPPQLGDFGDQQLIWSELTSQVGALGKVLLACAYGSQRSYDINITAECRQLAVTDARFSFAAETLSRYNCHVETSDTDMFILYAGETKDVLGLNPVQQTIKSSEIEDYDYTILEVSRFCDLLVAGDPKCVEALFIHPTATYFIADEFMQLTVHRLVFLTRFTHQPVPAMENKASSVARFLKFANDMLGCYVNGRPPGKHRQCAEKYLSDATGSKGIKQLNKLYESGEACKIPMPAKVSKLAYVIIRLLLSARDLFRGKELLVYRHDDDPDRTLLINIRRGTYTYDQVRSVIDSLLQEIEETRRNSSDAPAEDRMANVARVTEDWLLRLRFKNFVQYMSSSYGENISISTSTEDGN